jgi:hypothetical protein
VGSQPDFDRRAGANAPTDGAPEGSNVVVVPQVFEVNAPFAAKSSALGADHFHETGVQRTELPAQYLNTQNCPSMKSTPARR